MPMKSLVQGTAFKVGFFSGIILFVGLNFYSMAMHWKGLDLWGWPGIPFPFLDGFGDVFSAISWGGLLADIVFALALSFCIGVTVKSVSTEISK